MEARSAGCVGSQRVLGDVSELPGQTAAARRRRVYTSGEGRHGHGADLRRAPDFAAQSMGHVAPGPDGSARVSGVELVRKEVDNEYGDRRATSINLPLHPKTRLCSRVGTGWNGC